MYLSFCQSPLGPLKIEASETGLCSVLFIEEGTGAYLLEQNQANDITRNTVIQLHEYFNGQRQVFELPLTPHGSAFQQEVWKELVKIPYGQTDTYGAIAHKLNNPLSVRAVGTANGRNPIAIIIPCHRVIGANGTLTGYAGGLWRKEYLLKLERAVNHPVQTELW
jgi:methylated-DNA-[protein]-cysteine S-methyltransferase